ncbi:MAG TPA: 3-hydroxyacyl-CoA dehydrogenase NAD-binding domain-containing protein [Euzebyales bacterium]|nr:3-hydroxyacyl-CoA dehydrogenase NAD-binding domain-containing protein [Euzebyales bacterium]
MTAVARSTFGVAGAGVIGAGWAVRALGRGLDVVVHDPAPGAELRLRAAVDRAWPAVCRLGLHPGADPARLTFAHTLDEVATRSGFVQEAVPEDLDRKRAVLATIDAVADPDVIIASSTSGLRPTALQDGLRHPERLIVGHPFNPVYLLPLVEVVAGEETAAATVACARAVYDNLDMHPLVVRGEVDGFLSDRLLEAMWREMLHLLAAGLATTAELDDAICYGPGLRWAAMGTSLTYHLAGGEGGMRHMLAQFAPALQWPWARFDAPPLTAALADALIDGTHAQAGGRSVAELEQLRDEALVSVMHALRGSGLGAGRIVARREERTLAAGAPQRWQAGNDVPAPLALYACTVAPDWVDYNRHMTESAYLYAFGWASDAFFRYIGIDEVYRDAGHSYYTVESHLVYRREVGEGAPLRFTTQLLGHDRRRLHLFHTMSHARNDEVLCTNEQLLVHVDTAAGRSVPVPPLPLAALHAIGAVHDTLPRPERAVMSIGR